MIYGLQCRLESGGGGGMGARKNQIIIAKDSEESSIVLRKLERHGPSPLFGGPVILR